MPVPDEGRRSAALIVAATQPWIGITRAGSNRCQRLADTSRDSDLWRFAVNKKNAQNFLQRPCLSLASHESVTESHFHCGSSTTATPKIRACHLDCLNISICAARIADDGDNQ